MSTNPTDTPRNAPQGDEQQADASGAAEVIQNEDGSITLAQSGVTSGPAPIRWTGASLKPDGRYGSLMVSKFINCLMYDGKKSLAEGVFYDSMGQIADKLKSD